MRRNFDVHGRQCSSTRPTLADWSGDRQSRWKELGGNEVVFFPFVVNVSEVFVLRHRLRRAGQGGIANISESSKFSNDFLGPVEEVDDDIRLFRDAHSPSLSYQKSHSFLSCGRRDTDHDRLKTGVDHDEVIKDGPGD
ncbi:hypothetical protein R1sor_015088 [Riccia sorocarpa]|uniref:Uncharacterized protein n=1 Tax=Riccia sorocarpa TaxID=122646 RepID=A0ABD3HF48_9MARC